MVGVVGDAGQDIGEPGLRIDIVELGGDDQALHEGSPLPATVGAGLGDSWGPFLDPPARVVAGIAGESVAPLWRDFRDSAEIIRGPR